MADRDGIDKRRVLRSALAILLPVPIVFWWGEARPDTLEGVELLAAAAAGFAVGAGAWLLAGWITNRVT